MSLWNPNLDEKHYKNPVLFADYSDPDAVRVGEDIFLVASSFNNVPGLPVLHSRDLINWTIINHCIERLPFERYDKPLYGNAVWAPAIRHHNGLFYVFVPFPDEGIFVTTAKDPWGQWSPLRCIREAKGWIDPCPFWDDDGQAYMVHAYAASRAGFNSTLSVSRMSPEATRLLDDQPTHVFDGHATQPTIEGPKMYKRGGWYYIFAPAGGVATGWQTILRSRSVWGPYEEKIVLRQKDTPVNGPHQGAWISMPGGDDWFLHFQERQPYGRVVHLQPMSWGEDGWPRIGVNQDDEGVGEPALTWMKPAVYPQSEAIPATSDEFESPELGRQWQWNANPAQGWQEIRIGLLRLFATEANPERLWDAPNLLMQKFPAPSFTVTVDFDASSLGEDGEFGLLAMAEQYAAACVRMANGTLQAYIRSGEGRSRLPRRNAANDAPLAPPDQLAPCDTRPVHFLRMEYMETGICSFYASADGERYTSLGEAALSRAPLFIGARIGMYVMAGRENSGYADVRSFIVT